MSNGSLALGQAQPLRIGDPARSHQEYPSSPPAQGPRRKIQDKLSTSRSAELDNNSVRKQIRRKVGYATALSGTHREFVVGSWRLSCRADEAAGMPVLDPTTDLASVDPMRCSKPMRPALRTGIVAASPFLRRGQMKRRELCSDASRRSSGCESRRWKLSSYHRSHVWTAPPASSAELAW